MICPLCANDVAEGAALCLSCGYALSADRADALPIGAVVGGRYRIESILGIGGFGVTYKAFDQRTAGVVALKERVPPGSTRAPDGRLTPNRTESAAALVRRSLQEAHVLREVVHPNVVRILDTFDEGNTAFIGMEYLEGETVEMALNSSPAWSEQQTIDLLKPICSALSTVHAKNFLHRDVKPANIMLVPGRGPVLIDFGSSRESSTMQTSLLTQIVTPGYAAPEQYGSRGRVGPFTDLYAVGSLTYHCLTGAPPPPATDRLAQDDLVPLAQACPHLRSGLGDAVDQALRLRAADRPQSIAEFFEIANFDAKPKLSPSALANTVKMDLPRGMPAVQAPESLSRELTEPEVAPVAPSMEPDPMLSSRIPISREAVPPTVMPLSNKPNRNKRRILLAAIMTSVALAVVGGLLIADRSSGDVGVGNGDVDAESVVESIAQSASPSSTVSPTTTRVANAEPNEPVTTVRTPVTTPTQAPVSQVPATTPLPPTPAPPISQVPFEAESGRVTSLLQSLAQTSTIPASLPELIPDLPAGETEATTVVDGPVETSSAFIGIVFRSTDLFSLETMRFASARAKQAKGLAVKTCDLAKVNPNTCLTDWSKKPGLVGLLGMSRNGDVDSFSSLVKGGVPAVAVGPLREDMRSVGAGAGLLRLTPNVSQLGEAAAREAATDKRTRAIVLRSSSAEAPLWDPAAVAFSRAFKKQGTVVQATNTVVTDPAAYDTIFAFGLDAKEASAALQSLGPSWTGSFFISSTARDMNKQNCGRLTACIQMEPGVATVPPAATSVGGGVLSPGSWGVLGADAFGLLNNAFTTSQGATLTARRQAMRASFGRSPFTGLVGTYSFQEGGVNVNASSVGRRYKGISKTPCVLTATNRC
jgi:serine/threonine protein kinase